MKTEQQPADLAQRHHIEEVFHDEKTRHMAAPSKRMNFYGPAISDDHLRVLLAAVGDLKGKTVLDFGCGLGGMSRTLADMGAARVEGFDISGENVEVARRNAEKEGYGGRLFFRRLAAEDIDYADESFDLVIGKAVLHHTDLEKTSAQIYRVLRPGGAAYFLEPLGHNPFINFFRRLTPSRRTPTERPIRMKELEPFRRRFASVECRGFHLFTLASYFLLVVTGSKKLYDGSLSRLRRWETPTLERFPGLQKYCWTALMVFHKSSPPAGEEKRGA